MAELFGAIAAGIAVGSELIRLGRLVQKKVKRIQDSRGDIAELASETIIFTGLYNKFLRACEDDSDAFSTDVAAIRPLISWAEKTVDSLEKLLEKVESLHPQKKPRSHWEERTIARLVWAGSENTVRALRASLSVARESISGFTNLMCLEKLREQLRDLRKALRDPSQRRILEGKLGMTIEDRMHHLDRSIADTIAVHDENMKLQGKAERRITKCQNIDQIYGDIPAQHELSNFTEALHEYARTVVPPRRQRSRANSSSLNSSASRSGSGSSLSSLPSRHSSPSSVNSGDTSSREARVRGGNPSSGQFIRLRPMRPTAPLRVASVPTHTPDVKTPVSIPVQRVEQNRAQNAKRPVHGAAGYCKATSSSTTTHENPIAIPRSVPITQAPTIDSESDKKSIDARVSPEGKTADRSSQAAMNQPDDPNKHSSIPQNPRIKDTSASPRTVVRIGRHTLILTATELFVNQHSPLHMDGRYLGERFLEAIKQHRDQLDKLDEALSQGHEDWDGIPGWIVRPRGVPGVPDV